MLILGPFKGRATIDEESETLRPRRLETANDPEWLPASKIAWQRKKHERSTKNWN